MQMLCGVCYNLYENIKKFSRFSEMWNGERERMCLNSENEIRTATVTREVISISYCFIAKALMSCELPTYSTAQVSGF